MKKNELITKVSEKLGITKVAVGELLEKFDTIVEVIVEDGTKTDLGAYLALEVVDVEAREARNPSTGETIQVPAGKKVKVKARKSLKDLVK